MPRGYMYDVNELTALSQEHGLNDRQIAEKLGCARETITRLRRKCGIPKCNIKNRKDKTYICVQCGTLVNIKRSQRRQALCDDCSEAIAKNK